MKEFQYEIVRQIGALSESPSGWRKELNLVSWNGNAPKYDLRDWGPDHLRVGKGAVLTAEEAKALLALLWAEL